MSGFLKRRTMLGATVSFVAMTPAAGWADDAVDIAGVGSSFVAGAMRRWIDQKPAAIGAKIVYHEVGSAKGQAKVLAGEVDFAAVDRPLPADKLTNGEMIQFPAAFSGLAIAVNLPGIANNQLVLTGSLLASIYSGKIKTWNDPAIAQVNSGIKLPATDIRPLTHGLPAGEMSGITFHFTQYLLATNADWRATHGAAITKRWAVGSMVASVADMVQNLKLIAGGIGYVPVAALQPNGLVAVKLTNKAGKNTEANLASTRAALAAVDWSKPNDLASQIIDAPGDGSWPIVVPTYVLMPKKPASKDRAGPIRAFFRYVLTAGDAAATEQNMVLLPPAAQKAVLALIE